MNQKSQILSMAGALILIGALPASAQDRPVWDNGAPIRVVAHFGSSETCLRRLEVERLPITEPVLGSFTMLPDRFYLCVTVETVVFERDEAGTITLLSPDVIVEGAELELWPSNVGFPTNPPRLTAMRLELRTQPGERAPSNR